jgi:hypothetical protein
VKVKEDKEEGVKEETKAQGVRKKEEKEEEGRKEKEENKEKE